jgi:regulator of sirC expression with transglutaminase-like and TPR domain
VGATDRFVALVQGPEDGIDLDEGCLLVAAHARPGADAGEVVEAGRARLDALAETCTGPSLTDLRRHLFETVGFSGNRHRYDDPRNSLLDEVLERRTGIPITLAVVVIEVGRRLGLRFDGIGLPGHFLVGVGPDLYLDAFEEGRLLDTAGCRRRFAEMAGADAPWSAGLLAPVGPRAVLARVLANLRAVFAESRDLHSLEWVLRLRLAIPGVPVQERVERATVLSALGRYDEAAIELDRLAERMEALDPSWPPRHPAAASDPSADAAELRARAARLRARLN